MNNISTLNIRDLSIFNYIAITIINFIVFILLVTVFLHGRFKDKKSKTFVLMSFFMLAWVDFAFLARIFGFYQNISLIFLRIAWIATPPLFFSTYLISILMVEKDRAYKYLTLILLIITSVLSFLTAFTDLIISGVKFKDGTLDIIYGYGFFPFLFLILGIMVSTVVPILRSHINKRTRYFLVGVIVFYLANSVFNIGLPVFKGFTSYYYLGDYSTSILLGFTAYSIIRHKLFDIKVIGVEVLTVLIWAVLLSEIFVAKDFNELLIDFVLLILTVIFGFFLIRNVLREVEQKKELEGLNRKLKELDQVKNEFISVAAHELRAPLTAVKGYLSMILDGDAGTITAQTRDFLQDIQLSTERMIRLVSNMLDVGRIEEGRIAYNLEDVNLTEIVNTAYSEFKLEAERKNLKFTLDIQSNVRDRVHVDRDRLHEVVVNFLSNATKYTETGGITMKLFNKGLKIVRLEVIDTGMGISKEEQKKLFRKFYRVKSKVGKTIGSGLGLYISKLLIEKFEGNIGVDSEPGKGSNFWFELPVSS